MNQSLGHQTFSLVLGLPEEGLTDPLKNCIEQYELGIVSETLEYQVDLSAPGRGRLGRRSALIHAHLES